MTDTTNRVLTLAEVLALPEGAKVWVEHWNCDKQPFSREIDCVYTARIVEHEDYGLTLFERDGCSLINDRHWLPEVYCENYGKCYRVWSLPQPPTQEELEKNPWEVQDDG